jgi:hypothetical protein
MRIPSFAFHQDPVIIDMLETMDSWDIREPLDVIHEQAKSNVIPILLLFSEMTAFKPPQRLRCIPFLRVIA